MARAPVNRRTVTAAGLVAAAAAGAAVLGVVGLGARVAQALAKRAPAPVEFIGLQTYAESGTPEGVPAKYGLTSQNVVAAAERAIARKKR